METITEQKPIKIKSKDRPRKERYRNPNYDAEYQRSERGKEVRAKYVEAHFEACRNRIYRCQIKKTIKAKEELLSQIKEDSDLYKKTLEFIQRNKQRLEEIENTLKLNKEEQLLIKKTK